MIFKLQINQKLDLLKRANPLRVALIAGWEG